MESEFSSDKYYLKMIEDGIAQAATRNETKPEKVARRKAERLAKEREEQEYDPDKENRQARPKMKRNGGHTVAGGKGY